MNNHVVTQVIVNMELSPPSPPESPQSPPALLLTYSSDEVVDSSASAASLESFSEQHLDETNMQSPVDSSDCTSMSMASSIDGSDVDIMSDQMSEESQSSEDGKQPISLNAGYKIVFDNIDKNVKPRHMRSDNQTKSLHYVHSYAVRDRVNYSCISDEPRTEINAFDILPTEEDYQSLKADFSNLISRLIVKYMPFFKDSFKDIPLKHIPHQYSKEMASKSDIVSSNWPVYYQADLKFYIEYYVTVLPNYSGTPWYFAKE